MVRIPDTSVVRTLPDTAHPVTRCRPPTEEVPYRER